MGKIINFGYKVFDGQIERNEFIVESQCGILGSCRWERFGQICFLEIFWYKEFGGWCVKFNLKKFRGYFEYELGVRENLV